MLTDSVFNLIKVQKALKKQIHFIGETAFIRRDGMFFLFLTNEDLHFINEAELRENFLIIPMRALSSSHALIKNFLSASSCEPLATAIIAFHQRIMQLIKDPNYLENLVGLREIASKKVGQILFKTYYQQEIQQLQEIEASLTETSLAVRKLKKFLVRRQQYVLTNLVYVIKRFKILAETTRLSPSTETKKIIFSHFDNLAKSSIIQPSLLLALQHEVPIIIYPSHSSIPRLLVLPNTKATNVIKGLANPRMILLSGQYANPENLPTYIGDGGMQLSISHCIKKKTSVCKVDPKPIPIKLRIGLMPDLTSTFQEIAAQELLDFSTNALQKSSLFSLIEMDKFFEDLKKILIYMYKLYNTEGCLTRSRLIPDAWSTLMTAIARLKRQRDYTYLLQLPSQESASFASHYPDTISFESQQITVSKKFKTDQVLLPIDEGITTLITYLQLANNPSGVVGDCNTAYHILYKYLLNIPAMHSYTTERHSEEFFGRVFAILYSYPESASLLIPLQPYLDNYQSAIKRLMAEKEALQQNICPYNDSYYFATGIDSEQARFHYAMDFLQFPTKPTTANLLTDKPLPVINKPSFNENMMHYGGLLLLISFTTAFLTKQKILSRSATRTTNCFLLTLLLLWFLINQMDTNPSTLPAPVWISPTHPLLTTGFFSCSAIQNNNESSYQPAELFSLIS
ncbi:MAG: hypothetical protein A3E87_03880 [Gammaproteobacteria bacterium RIFCSPHIGHO2_12_FULL_35_23]|nr:MAG: hypothetical protein A3E87_03880 [Gammaproteobacteria bacterium RIFCSPHIGHO2_12_FULL_35_23]